MPDGHDRPSPQFDRPIVEDTIRVTINSCVSCIIAYTIEHDAVLSVSDR
jgi:hypothetical protein